MGRLHNQFQLLLGSAICRSIKRKKKKPKRPASAFGGLSCWMPQPRERETTVQTWLGAMELPESRLVGRVAKAPEAVPFPLNQLGS